MGWSDEAGISMHGSSKAPANGRVEWKDELGRTLKKTQEASLPATGEGEE